MNNKLIPKYQLGRHIWRSYFDYDPNKGVFIGKKTKNEYKALDAYNKMRLENWSKSYDDFYDLNNYHSTHKSKYVFTPNILTNYSQQQQLIDYAKRTGININDVVLPTTKIYTSNNSNSLLWKPEFWAKIGNSHKGIKTPEEYGKYFDEWFKTSGINPKYRDEIFKKNWELYLKLGFSKLPSNTNTRNMTDGTNISSGSSEITTVSEEEEPQYLNGMKYVYQDGKFTLVPEQSTIDQNKNGQTPEVEATKQETVQPTAPTYESLVKVNTASMNDNINSGGFRREYRKAFNKALLDGTIYGVNNPNGTQVFDSNAVIGYNKGNPIYATAANIMQKYGWDGKISRRDMRMLRKDIIGNLNLVRMNNISNFFGITSPAVTTPAASPVAKEVVSPLPVNNNVYDPTGKFKAVQDGTYGNSGYNPLEDESIKSEIQFTTR